ARAVGAHSSCPFAHVRFRSASRELSNNFHERRAIGQGGRYALGAEVNSSVAAPRRSCDRDNDGLDRVGAGRECGRKKEMRMRRTMIAAAAMVMAASGHAAAQEWPTRPITLIVPFAAGGVDVSARIQAQRMGELLGQSIVIENVGAAAGMAGGARVAKAAPDGYTLLIGNTGTHAFNQSLYKKPLYDAAADFEPVGLVS